MDTFLYFTYALTSQVVIVVVLSNCRKFPNVPCKGPLLKRLEVARAPEKFPRNSHVDYMQGPLKRLGINILP